MMWDFGGRGYEQAQANQTREWEARANEPSQIRTQGPGFSGFPEPSPTGPTSPIGPYDYLNGSSYAGSSYYPSYVGSAGPSPRPPPILHHSISHEGIRTTRIFTSHAQKHHKHSYSTTQTSYQPSSSFSMPQASPTSPSVPASARPSSMYYPQSSSQYYPPPVKHHHSDPSPSQQLRINAMDTSKAAVIATPNGNVLYKPRPVTSPHDSKTHYSTCTGRKRAVCIGINYIGQSRPLRGCVNDARHVREFLLKHGYRSSQVMILTDDSPDPRLQPTRSNIIAAMRWLVEGARTNDSLFFHYSGHGGQVRDLNGDEADGWDEVIYPVDYRKKGHILDDDMHDIMVKPLPKGCRLTALFDACHSGTVLDLPYIYSSHGRLKGKQISDKYRRRMSTPADVISWSGCKDDQTSADTFHGGVAVGAMSYAFMKALTDKPHQTYQELLRSVRLILHPRYSQRPQLGSSHHINTGLQFVF